MSSSEDKYKHSKRRFLKSLKKKLSMKLFGCVKYADNLKACSCWMCQNPRRIFKGKDKRTVQERKYDGRDDLMKYEQNREVLNEDTYITPTGTGKFAIIYRGKRLSKEYKLKEDAQKDLQHMVLLQE